jgi:hypothetical protein
MNILLNILLLLSFVAAVVMSFIVWAANLKVASDVNQPVDGIGWVYLTWGVFFVFVLLKLMAIGAH